MSSRQATAQTGKRRLSRASWRMGMVAGGPWIVWAGTVLLVPTNFKAPFAAIGAGLLLLAFVPGIWDCPVVEKTASEKRISWQSILPLVLVIVASWWVYHPIFEGGWMGDDPRLVRSAVEHGWLAHFNDPGAWRALSGSFFTPILPVSLGLDLQLFGLATPGFYLHHLLSFTLALYLVYILLVRWISPLMSAMAVFLFAMSAASAGLVQQLMTRHYIEGLVFFSLTVLLVLRAARTGRSSLIWPAAGCALLSMLAKEIYVPLVAVLTVAPLGLGWRRQARLVSTLVAAVGVALIWRWFMLGPNNFWVGYSSLGGQLPMNAMDGLRRLAEVAGIDRVWQVVTYGVFGLAAAAIVAWNSCRSILLFWLALGAVVAASIVPVIGSPAPRYLWLPTLLAAIVSAFALDQIARWRFRAVTLALSAVLLASGFVAIAGSPLWVNRNSVAANRALAEFVLFEGDANAVVLTDLGTPLEFHSLTWLRRHCLDLGPGPRVCADQCVCPVTATDEPFRMESGKVVKIPETEHIQPQNCGDDSAPLQVDIVYRSDQAVLSWRFGPYRNGRYLFAGPAGEDHVSGHFRPLPATGQIALTLHEPLVFVVRYEAPDGWFSDSPRLCLVPGHAGDEQNIELRWQRANAAENTGVKISASGGTP